MSISGERRPFEPAIARAALVSLLATERRVRESPLRHAGGRTLRTRPSDPLRDTRMRGMPRTHEVVHLLQQHHILPVVPLHRAPCAGVPGHAPPPEMKSRVWHLAADF